MSEVTLVNYEYRTRNDGLMEGSAMKKMDIVCQSLVAGLILSAFGRGRRSNRAVFVHIFIGILHVSLIVNHG